jgi:hypothetical protein
MTTNKTASHRKRGFTVLPTKLLQDQRIGVDGVGLLAYMLSLPDDWKFTIDSLARYFSSKSSPQALPHAKTTGRDAIGRILLCLREAGYITVERHSDGTTTYHIYDDALDNPHPENPDLVLPPSGKASSGKASSGKSACITKDYSLQKTIIHKQERGEETGIKSEESIVDRLIAAFEIGNYSLVKADMRSRGELLPWRLNGKNSNSATNFDRRLLDRVLRYLRTTPSGKESTIADAARWVSIREVTADGLRAVNTHWEECLEDRESEVVVSVQPTEPPNQVEATAGDTADGIFQMIGYARGETRERLIRRLSQLICEYDLQAKPEWETVLGGLHAA